MPLDHGARQHCEVRWGSAQYVLHASKWDWQHVIGGYYPLEVVSEASDLFTAAISASRPNEDSWSLPIFSFDLHQPTLAKDKRAAIGDLVIYRFDTPVRTLAGGAETFTRLWTTAFVVEVKAGGVVAVIEGMDGRRLAPPRHYEVIPMAQFTDRAAVAADLHSRHELFLAAPRHSCPTGFYDAPRQVLSSVLRPYLARRPAAPVDVENAIRQVQAATCIPPLRPALPIDVPALQRKIDALIAQSEPLPFAA